MQVAGEHSFQLLLKFTVGEAMAAGASTGVTLFDGAGKLTGLNIALRQPTCLASSELVQSDLMGTELGPPLTPPSALAANGSEAAVWCKFTRNAGVYIFNHPAFDWSFLIDG